MRVFQVGNVYPVHLNQMRAHLDGLNSHSDINQAILEDVAHAQILQPCLHETDGSSVYFPQYERGLRIWAAENGILESATLDDILAAQIEHANAEVFYSINSTRHSAEFLRRMPGCVRLKVGWLGSPSVGTGLAEFDAIVSCYPTFNEAHRKQGLKTHYLTPSYETQTDRFFDPAAERTVDVFFAGVYSRHHKRRAQFLEMVAQRSNDWDAVVRLHLLNSRYTALAENTPLGWFQPFRSVRRPMDVRRVAQPPIFGAQMFEQLCASKVVINMSIDHVGLDRGNMRCFETMSAGALMIDEAGNPPDAFVPGETHLTYTNFDEALTLVRNAFIEPDQYNAIGLAGAHMMRQRYSKKRQWDDFVELCNSLNVFG